MRVWVCGCGCGVGLGVWMWVLVWVGSLAGGALMPPRAACGPGDRQAGRQVGPGGAEPVVVCCSPGDACVRRAHPRPAHPSQSIIACN